MKGKRVGVIFSGGTAAGMNATLEYLCRYANMEGAQLIGFRHGWKGLIESNVIECSLESTLGVGLTSGGMYLGSCSKVNVFDHENKDYSQNCYETYKARQLDGIFVLGGDGTNRQANDLNTKYPDMKFIWISATLDRDVLGCDDTIGFHTAFENAAEVIASMANDGKTMCRHTITECMGRHSGFVTVHAANLAIRKYHTEIDMVIIPEIEFDLPAICNRISQTPYPLTIVISEGIKIPEEVDRNSTDGAGEKKTVGHHEKLSNTCSKLMNILMKHSKLDIRTEIAGYLQRTGPLSSADTFLAENCAKLAVRKAIDSDESMAIVFHELAFKAIPMRELIKINTPSDPQANPNEIFEKKRAMLLSDPVVYAIQEQLAAAAYKRIIF